MRAEISLFVAHTAIPHRVMTDDFYKGYFIPKDSIVIGNAWSILHDPELYPDPFTFDPHHFLSNDPDYPIDPKALAAVDHAFGFGRRMCPGRWMAMSFAWITMVSVLASFEVGKKVDKEMGEVKEPKGEFSSGIMGYVVASFLFLLSSFPLCLPLFRGFGYVG